MDQWSWGFGEGRELASRSASRSRNRMVAAKIFPDDRMTLWKSIISVGLVLAWGLAVGALAQPGVGIQQEGDYAVFRTGAGEPLLTTNIAVEILEGVLGPRLEFEVGFSTSEFPVSGNFLDSFSITLQSQDAALTALLGTFDAAAVVWAPANPGGLVLDENTIELVAVPFPALLPEHALRYSFAVSLAVPSPFFGLTAWVFFDLFDNQDSLASMAYARNVRVESVPSTNFPIGLRLWSSTSASGPYAEETGWSLDLINGVIVLPYGGTARFYQTRASLPTRVISIRRTGNEMVLGYAFDPGTLLLESAADPAGPYTVEATAIVDVARQTVRVEKPATSMYYRIRSNAVAVIVEVRQEGNGLALRYEFPWQPVELLSSAAAVGPFAPESALRHDPNARTIRIPQGGAMRFFRVTADRALKITRLQLQDGRWVLNYK